MKNGEVSWTSVPQRNFGQWNDGDEDHHAYRQGFWVAVCQENVGCDFFSHAVSKHEDAGHCDAEI